MSAALIVPSMILIAGLVDDLKSKKVHNWLALSLAAAAALGQLVFYGLDGLLAGLYGGLTAIAMMLPFVLVRIIGAGDMKLMVAFGIATSMTTVFWTFLFSFVWGALLGLFRALLSKQGKKLILNSFRILRGSAREDLELQTMPYTVALFFGWLTHVTLNGGIA
jgi:prepilin peptidase CpaA